MSLESYYRKELEGERDKVQELLEALRSAKQELTDPSGPSGHQQTMTKIVLAIAKADEGRDQYYDRGHCPCGKDLGRGPIDEIAPQFCSAKCKRHYATTNP